MDVRYINILSDNKEYVDILDAFSKRNVTGKIEKTDLKIFDFMEIKKNPLFRTSDKYNRNLITYLILDNKLLLEKPILYLSMISGLII